MLSYLKKGLGSAARQPFAVTILFLYQFGWGVFLYKCIQSVLVPLLHRYPGEDQGAAFQQLFWAEAHFQLVKTDLVLPYVWWLLGLMAIRLFITPLLNAGLYYSLVHTELNAGYRFVKGIKTLILPFLGYYLLQMLLLLTPLYFLIKKAASLFNHAGSYKSFLIDLLPWAIGYLAFGYLLQLGFMYLQFGHAHRVPFLKRFGIMLRSLLPMIITAFCILIISLAVTAAEWTASYVWAGLTALIVYQALTLIRLFTGVWAVAAQHELWKEKLLD